MQTRARRGRGQSRGQITYGKPRLPGPASRSVDNLSHGLSHRLRARPYVQTRASGEMRQTEERRGRILPRRSPVCRNLVLITGAFVFPGAARCAQHFGQDRDRGGIFDPLRQSLPQSRAARVLRAGPAYRHPFLCAQRSARRAPRPPPASRIGPHLFRCLSPTDIVSRGVSPPSEHPQDGPSPPIPDAKPYGDRQHRRPRPSRAIPRCDQILTIYSAR